MEKTFIENIAASLVREYLSRKNLRTTLATMDEEMPRNEHSVSNRNKLLQILKLERLSRKNKDLADPLRTMLELMTKHFLEKATQSWRGSTPLVMSYKHGDMETLTDAQDGDMAEESPRPNRYIKKSAQQKSKSEITEEHDTSSCPPAKEPTPPPAPEPVVQSKQSGIDLVIEDNIEGETILGEGKTGLIDKPDESTIRQPVSRPRSSVRRGMAGPISSNLDERDRRRQPRKHSARPSSSLRSKPTPSVELAEKHLDVPKTELKSRSETNVSLRTSNAISELAPAVNTESRYTVTRDAIKDVLKVNASPVARPRSSRRTSHENLLWDNTDLKKNETPSSSDGVRPSPARRKESLTSEGVVHGISGTVCVADDKPPVTESTESLLTERSETVTTAACAVGDVEIGDVDDLDAEVANLDLQAPVPPVSRSLTSITDSRPIDIHTAVELKTLIFGLASQAFNNEWKNQSFGFCDMPGLEYGIIQHKGGPCGVIASVQACMLKELLFGVGKEVKNKLTPDRELRSLCLATALRDILWRAGEQEMAVVAIPTGRSIFVGSGRYKPDNLTETLVLNHFTSHEELLTFLKANIHVFEMDGSCGVILLLYSAILSRSIDRVRNDMDVPTGQLMGAHGYCTQDMVNLLLTGHAASNVFNDQMELDSGGQGPAMILKGVQGRSDVGLLSLFEHYKSCQVGTYLKTPKFPIWVVCSESHFSVLFSVKKELMTDWRAERRFDLYYFDGLGKQDEVIRLSIDTTNRFFEPPTEDDLVPPLELCIRTKWNDAQIDWNGTDPLL